MIDFVECVKFWCWPSIVTSFWWRLAVLVVEIKFAADWFGVGGAVGAGFAGGAFH